MEEEVIEQQEQSIADVFANAKPEDFKRVDNVSHQEYPVTTEEAPEPEKTETVEAVTETPETVEDTPAPVIETPAAVKEVAEQAKPVVTDWKAEVKKVPFEEALKELGLDEFEIGLLKYRKETGDLTPYLEAKTVDYSKLSDEQIMRRDLRSQYKELSDDEFELLYQDEVSDRFKLDPDVYDESQIKIGQLKLKVEANKVRQRLAEEQSKFKAPEKQKEVSNEPDYAELAANWTKVVNGNEATKALLESKRLVLGGKDSFNYEVENPQSAIDAVLDNTKFWDLFTTETGHDLGKFYKVAVYANNMEKYEKSLIDYGKSLGRKAVDNELKNPSKPDAGSVHSETTNDLLTGIGEAFLKKGVHKRN